MGRRKTQQEFENEINVLTCGEYTVLGIYANNKSPIQIQHNRCGHIWDVRPDNFTNGSRCPKCHEHNRSNYLKWTHDYVVSRIEELDEGYKVLSEYNGAKYPIKVKHIKCGCEWSPQVYDLLNGASICPRCSKNEKLDTDKFKGRVFQEVGNEYSVIGEYKNSQTKIKMKHNICNNFYDTKPNWFLTGRRCPICKESKGENKIRKWLEYNNMNFIPQFSFTDLLSPIGNYLKFDFAIINKEMDTPIYLIEYDGIGHYSDLPFGIKSYKTTVCHDAIKNSYCDTNDLRLIRIPYWEFDNIEMILNDKITVEV
jgi:Zn ribbon nucleic-acid-binding protein